jgi:predicted kinase
MAVAHAEARTSDEIASVASPAALAHLWDQNLRELEPFAPPPLAADDLAEVGKFAHEYLDGRRELLLDRMRHGRVIDGHGDLLADDIYCLDDGPRLLDCLEFDDRLRWGDVLYDIGFLAMDLERLGRPDLARSLLGWYREFSAEAHPESLEHHYIAYRALVRAKISCLRGTSTDHDEARAYLTRCLQHLHAGQVRLVLVGGLPATGKSTLAMALGDQLGWAVLRSDELRKEQAGMLPTSSAAAPYEQGLYSPANTEATYEVLLAEAGQMLREGMSVVLDASFSRTRWREAAAVVAADASARLHEIRCTLRHDIVTDRLAERRSRGDASDADVEVARAMAADFEPWPSAVEVDTGPPRAVVAALAQKVVAPSAAPERGA